MESSPPPLASLVIDESASGTNDDVGGSPGVSEERLALTKIADARWVKFRIPFRVLIGKVV